MTIHTRADRPLIRAHGDSVRYLLVRIEAPAAASGDTRSPVNMSFVLDRSGSMHGEKIELAREAVLTAVKTLGADDRFSVVVYDNQIDVVMPSTTAHTEARRRAADILRSIGARGTTALYDGWLTGCEQIAQHLDDESVARCLLLTDGLANVGVTDAGAITHEARQLATRGVGTTTLGVGYDFDEHLLDAMATAGRGNFYYIEQAGQIPDYIASEVGEALEVVARDVTIELRVPRGVRVSSLNDAPADWRRSHGGSAGRFSIGPLVSEQLYEALFELRFPAGTVGDRQELEVRVEDAEAVLAQGAGSDGGATVGFTFAPHSDNDRQERDVEIDRLVAEIYAGRAQREGLEAQRRGDYQASARVLRRTARRMRGYANDDEHILALSVELDTKAEAYSAPMPSHTMKEEQLLSHTRCWRRDEQGRAQRRRRAETTRRAEKT